MLQYDLTNTLLFDTDAPLPTEAELSIFTFALMLVKGFSYSRLKSTTLCLDAQSVEPVAKCIESYLSIFINDVGHGEQLRNRLKGFVGMRIDCFAAKSKGRSREQTQM